MKKWEKLVPGDIIDIIAPGFATSDEVVALAKSLIESRGFVARASGDLISPHYFHSNTDEKRFAQAKKALLAKDSKAVWCLRGGYGSNRLLPMLAKLPKPVNAKVLIGISDITSLHLHLNQKWKWCSLHGALLDRPAQNKLPKTLLDEMFDILSGQITDLNFPDLKPMNLAARKVKKKKARIFGGNLTTLQSAIGTPYQLKTGPHFLFLEELGERGYKVDRMLVHLKQSGSLRNCAGILLGHFIGGDEPQSDLNYVPQVLQRFADENPKLPVWSGIESGHAEQLRTLPFGCEAQIQVAGGKFNLTVETGCR